MKMKADAKLITLMNIIDENLARIFLQITPLKEAIKATIDLSSFETRLQQLQNYADEVVILMNNDEHIDLSFLKGEIEWSLSQCDKYLKILVPTEAEAETENFQIENSRTVLRVIIEYKQVLTRMFNRFEHL